MRRSILMVVAVLLAFLFVRLSKPQTASGTGQTTPEARAAAYDTAMKSRDWVNAVAVAREAVENNATSVNLRRLADAQLYAGAQDQSLATYERALAAAEQERPAQGQPTPIGRKASRRSTLARETLCSSSTALPMLSSLTTARLNSRPIAGWLISTSALSCIT